MKKQKISIYLFMGLFAFGLITAGCSKKDDDTPTGSDIEALALSPEWNTYLVAATSELLDDCTALWAAWNGPTGLTDEEKARIGNDFFTTHGDDIGTGGYAEIFKAANGDYEGLTTEIEAIQMLIEDGCINIAGEVGEQKIGGPYDLAKSGKTDQAVLEVESWYSWNSITDYADNITSIKNSYWGGRNLSAAHASSISAFVKSQDSDLDAAVVAAIDNARAKIQGIPAPFRNNLTADEVDEAMDACADLVEIFETEVIPLLEGTDYDFTPVLAQYADAVVVPTYRDMKNAAKTLYDNAVAYNSNPTQANLDKVCEAWRANRIPWEQSEAFLFGPADILGLDPSLDSWPLDQNAIGEVLKSIQSGATVAQVIGKIQEDEIRGFHTIELLLFKDGANRKVK
ncbi:MAG: hypothetical protein LBR08_04255 [Bacteroidales bacterium]|jgi:hypothetical protein|nr:hypothetical protein [Bacteroidales bacterium]